MLIDSLENEGETKKEENEEESFSFSRVLRRKKGLTVLGEIKRSNAAATSK